MDKYRLVWLWWSCPRVSYDISPYQWTLIYSKPNYIYLYCQTSTCCTSCLEVNNAISIMIIMAIPLWPYCSFIVMTSFLTPRGYYGEELLNRTKIYWIYGSFMVQKNWLYRYFIFQNLLIRLKLLPTLATYINICDVMIIWNWFH